MRIVKKCIVPLVLASIFLLPLPAFADSDGLSADAPADGIVAAGEAAGDETEAVNGIVDTPLDDTLDSPASPGSDTEPSEPEDPEPIHEDGWETTDEGVFYWSNGAKATGWLNIDGERYYFDPTDSHMYSGGILEIDGDEFFFNENGTMGTGWIRNYGDSSSDFFFDRETGKRITSGWIVDNGTSYYIDPNTGAPLSSGFFDVDGSTYCFDPEGALVKGWVSEDGDIYYFDTETGAMVTDRTEIIQGLCAPLSAVDESSFTDVGAQTPHGDDVVWMYETGISTGWLSSDGTRTFRPLSFIVRQDMAAFLYRLAGSPDFTPNESDTHFFSDVTPDTPHAIEVWWLAHEGISTGWVEGNGSRTFRPMNTVVRQDMAAFLYRLSGSPEFDLEEEDTAIFTDVTSSTPHASEIWWLSSSGISTGWIEADGSRTFRPMNTIVRQDVAAFLHRMHSNDLVPPSEHEYLFAADGSLVTGWTDEGSFYSHTTGGRVESGWMQDGGHSYFISADTGDFLRNGIHPIAGYSYLFNAAGELQHGWATIDGSRRFFSPTSGAMYAGGIRSVDGANYCFGDDGALRTGFITSGGSTYYFDPSTGKMRSGLLSIDGSLYYFDPSTGKMVTNQMFIIDGTLYKAGADGKVVKQPARYLDMFYMAQGYSSPTDYLILINCYSNVLCVYRGSYGNWVPVMECLCSTGAPATATPSGIYYVGAKGYSFSGDGHTCYYYTQIYGDVLMHSILYHEYTFNVLDGRLGYHISGGCVRLDINVAKWIYDTVPYNSKIVVYR